MLYLVDSYRPSRSACANRTVVLVEALRKAGHDVQVLTSSDSLIGAPDDYEKPDYVTFFKTYPLVEKTLINRLKNNFGGCVSSIRAAKQMGEFDVVICTTPPLLLTESAIRISRQKDAKLILDIRDIWPDVAYEMGTFTPSSLYGKFFSRVASRGFACADLISSVSPGKVKKLRERTKSDKVILIPNGIDEAFLDDETGKSVDLRPYGIDGAEPFCVYAGNIGLAQGLDTLLDMAKERPEIQFAIFGNGADRSRLEKRVVNESLFNVRFCGSVDFPVIRAALSSAAFSYVPLVSSRLKDSIPTKLYESLACGCPVLLAAEGDSTELLDESKLGMHAPPENPETLLESLDSLVSRHFTDDERHNASQWVLCEHSRQRFAEDFVRKVEELFN